MEANKNYRTDQEQFWAGEFGNAYINRNQGAALLASNLNFFVKALNQARGIRSCIEFGANIGMNLKALGLLYPDLEMSAIEINQQAAEQLRSVVPPERIHHESILEFTPKRTWDLVLIKGVLIHINPDALNQVYDKLAQATGAYLLVAEYYSPQPVAIPYRGHTDRLFKRDFAGEMLERHPEFSLVDYGFVYRKDPSFPQDDVSWFLLRKR